MSESTPSLPDAIAQLAGAVVGVRGRRGYPLSGTAWAPDLVLTTARAAARDDDLRVRIGDGDWTEAELVGRDPATDLALLRTAGSELPVPARVPAGELRLGQPVARLGRGRLGLRVAAGVLAAIGGPWRTPGGGRLEAVLLSDAAPFRGFSGGPLITADGRVAGLNTMALSRDEALTLATGTLERIVAALAEHGRVRRGYLGVSGQPVRLPATLAEARGQRAGVLVSGVADGSPAAEAGIALGDTLLALDGDRFGRPEQLLALLDESTVGTTRSLELLRGGETTTLEVAIGERP